MRSHKVFTCMTCMCSCVYEASHASEHLQVLRCIRGMARFWVHCKHAKAKVCIPKRCMFVDHNESSHASEQVHVLGCSGGIACVCRCSKQAKNIHLLHRRMERCLTSLPMHASMCKWLHASDAWMTFRCVSSM